MSVSSLATRLQEARQRKPSTSAPKQAKLFATRKAAAAVREKPTIKSKLKLYVRENAAAARIILEDPVRYDGILIEWARLFQQEHPEA